MPSRVAAFLSRYRLLRGVHRLGVAVSGGPDSISLLLILHPICQRRHIELTILHLNHGLPGAAAEDTPRVRVWARQLGLPLFLRQAHVPVRADDNLSPEMRARAARQAFFGEAAAALKLDAIATGHQANDVAETLLLRLSRGAGLTGLSALRPRSRAPAKTFDFIRPLLEIPTGSLRTWLRIQHLDWHEDATNADLAVPRNVVRHRVLPYLTRVWGAKTFPNLCRTAEILRADDECLDAFARRVFKSCVRAEALRVRPLLRQPLALQRRVLRCWLFSHHLDASFVTIERLRRAVLARAEACFELAPKIHVKVDSSTLSVLLPRWSAAAEPARPVTLEPRSGASVIWGSVRITCQRVRTDGHVTNGIGRYPAACTINPAALHGQPLVIRARRSGDTIAPVGFDGHKKIRDMLINAKVPRGIRDAIPLVTCGEAVVWLPGYRPDQRFAVSPSTRERLRIGAEKVEN